MRLLYGLILLNRKMSFPAGSMSLNTLFLMIASAAYAAIARISK